MKIFIVFLLIFSQSAQAQYLFRGKILNSETKEPLAYAPIELQNENTGTLTNNDGFFELYSANPAINLKISYLGYESKTLSLTLLKIPKDTTIYLTPKAIKLDEVVVSPEKLENLIKALYDKFRKKRDDVCFAAAFYRDYSIIDDVPVNASEIFYHVSLNQSGIGKWSFMQGRSAEARDAVENPESLYLYSSLVNNSAFIRNFPLTHFSPSPVKEDFNLICILPVCKDPEANYIYSREGYKMIENKKVSVITFYPRRSLRPNTKTTTPFAVRPKEIFLFSGKMEVIEDELQIIYLEIELKNSRFFNRVVSIPYRNTRQQYIDNFYFKHFWQYNLVNNKWLPQRIGNTLKFQQRSSRDKTYKKINCQTSDIYFYDFSDTPLKNNRQNAVENDLMLIRENRYDSLFWKNNSNVITDLPFEKNIQASFLKNGFYGNLFPGGVAPEQYKECSDLENETIRRLNENYYFILRRLLLYYNPAQSEMRILFESQIFPAYRNFIQKIINHRINIKSLHNINKILDTVPNTFNVNPVLKLWNEMDPLFQKNIRPEMENLLPRSVWQ